MTVCFRSLLAITIAASIGMTGCSHFIKQETLLNQARAQYYDLQKAGVSEFHCTAQPDWNTFLASVGNHAPEPSAWHQYLAQGTLTFSEPMSGSPSITWVDPVPPPQGMEDLAHKEAAGFHDMLEGFLTAWQPSLNNTFLPSIPLSDITEKNGGYALTERDAAGRVSDIALDHNMRVLHSSTHGPHLTIDNEYQYISSANGLLLVELKSANTSEKTGAVEHSVLSTTYTDMDGFHIPASMLIVDQEGTRVPMQFKNCAIKR